MKRAMVTPCWTGGARRRATITHQNTTAMATRESGHQSRSASLMPTMARRGGRSPAPAGEAERGERELGHQEGGRQHHADQDDRGLVGDLDHGPTLNPIPPPPPPAGEGAGRERRGCWHPTDRSGPPPCGDHRSAAQWPPMDGDRITVFLADDNVLVREGVRALLLDRGGPRGRRGRRRTTTSWSQGADEPSPQVVVTDIRMPPSFQNEGIEAAKEVRKRHPGTGVVILSQYDDPEYAISLLQRGRGRLRLPAEGPRQRRRPAGPGRSARSRPAARCSTPRSCRRWSRPVTRRRRARPRTRTSSSARSPRAGRSRRSPSAASTTPEAVNDAIERLFLKLAQGASAGRRGRAAPAAAAAEGDRRPRGAGRDAQPAAARRRRRAAARRRPTRSARPSGSS